MSQALLQNPHGVLSAEEEAAFRASIAGVRRAAAAALEGLQGSANVVRFIAHLHRAVDEVTQRAWQAGPAPDCRAGCAHCCSLRVEATAPEVFRIARKLRVQPEAELAALVERLRLRVLAARSGLPGTRRLDCTFLASGALCSIYEQRPAACRKAHSLSVAACEAHAAAIPQNLSLVLDAEALMVGTAEAYRDVHLAASAHELLEAILLALSDATAEARWAAGVDVFASASAAAGAPGAPTG